MTLWQAAGSSLRVFASALWMTTAAVSAQAATSAQAAPEIPKLTIGTIFPLTGSQAAYGKEAARGIELALELLRQADPALGAHITILNGDDQSTVTEGASVAERMIAKDRAHLLIGSISSSATLPLAGVARTRHIPLMAPLATSGNLPLGANSYRTCLDESDQAAALAAYATTALTQSSLGILRDDTPGAQALDLRVATVLKEAGGSTQTEIYDLATEDYTPQLKKLKAAKVRYVFAATSYVTGGKAVQQSAQAKLGLRFLGTDGWDTAQFAKLAGDGHFVLAHFATDDPSPQVAAFVAAFQKKYGRAPGAIAALTFDAFNLAIDAFRRVGSNLKDQLNSAIVRTKDFEGVTGTLSFTEAGETVKAGVVKVTAGGALAFKARVPGRAPSASATKAATPGGGPAVAKP